MTKKLFILMLAVQAMLPLNSTNDYKPNLCKNEHALGNLRDIYYAMKNRKTESTSWSSWFGYFYSKAVEFLPFVGLKTHTKKTTDCSATTLFKKELKKTIGTTEKQMKKEFEATLLRDLKVTDLIESRKKYDIQRELQQLETEHSKLQEFPEFKIELEGLSNFIERNKEMIRVLQNKRRPSHHATISSIHDTMYGKIKYFL